jgi:antitoxin HigA-1
MTNLIPLEHPGTILREEFMVPYSLSAYKVAQGTGISQTALGQILNGKRKVTPNTGIKLSRFFGLSDEYFVLLQLQYDMDTEKEKEGKSIANIIPFSPKQNPPDNEDDLLEA